MDFYSLLLVLFVVGLGWFLYNSYDKETKKFNWTHGLAAVTAALGLVVTWFTHFGTPGK